MPEEDPTKYPESKCLLKMIERRLKDRLGVIMLFSGETGRGKSYAGLRLLEMWYQQNFKERFPHIHIVENLEQAVLLVRSFNRIGEGILIEELSVLASRRDALTNVNKLWNKFIDMCRIKQAVIVANAPHRSFIDSHFVMMTQAWVDCLKVDFKKEIVIARPLWLQTSPHKNEPYKHKFLTDEGFEIDWCYFKIPEDKELVEIYNKRKLQSFDDLSMELVMRMQKNRLEKFKELGQKRIPQREAQVYELYLKGEHPIPGAERLGISVNTYKTLLQRAKKRLKMVEYEESTKRIKEKVEKTTKRLQEQVRRDTS